MGAALAVLLIVLGGCSDPGGKAGPSTSLPSAPSVSSTSSSITVETSSAAPSTTSESLDPETEAVLTAYKGWFTTTTTLGPMSDEQAAAALSQYGSPEIVANAIKVLNEWRSQGKLPGGSVTFGEIELRVDGVQATARECRDGSTEVTIDANTGEIIGKGKPGQLALATLTKKTGSWLMYSFEATKNAC